MTNCAGDICAKRFRDDSGAAFWVIFRQGELSRPILIMHDALMVELAEVVLLLKNGGPQ